MFTARLGQLERRQGRLFSWPLSHFRELDEALHIRREEELPVYERLGDVRELIVGRVNLSLMLLKRGREEDRPEAQKHLVWAYQTAAQRGYRERADRGHPAAARSASGGTGPK